VRDGIEIAKRGRATVALVTEQFWNQGDFVAAAAGMPDLPRYQLPHPVAGTGKDAMSQLADRIADDLITTLRTPTSP
jgi:hypothetical protein